MTDIIFWGLIGLMVGWHTPAPFWATWFWNWAKSLITGSDAEK